MYILYNLTSEAYRPCGKVFLPAQPVDNLHFGQVFHTFADWVTLSGLHRNSRSRNSHQWRDMSFLGEFFVHRFSNQYYHHRVG